MREWRQGTNANLPVMEDGETERLSLRVSPQVCLEAKGIDGRYEGLDGIQWGTRNGGVLGHVTPEREGERGLIKGLRSRVG